MIKDNSESPTIQLLTTNDPINLEKDIELPFDLSKSSRNNTV